MTNRSIDWKIFKIKILYLYIKLNFKSVDRQVNNVEWFYHWYDHWNSFLVNDLCLNQNPYISSCHCTFEYENGHVFIRDTSSNGTLINRTNKITKTDPVSESVTGAIDIYFLFQRVELQTDDTVHLVFRKDEPEFSKSNNSCRNFRIHSFRCCFSTWTTSNRTHWRSLNLWRRFIDNFESKFEFDLVFFSRHTNDDLFLDSFDLP